MSIPVKIKSPGIIRTPPNYVEFLNDEITIYTEKSNYTLKRGDHITFMEYIEEADRNDKRKRVYYTIKHCAEVLRVDKTQIFCEDFDTKGEIRIGLVAHNIYPTRRPGIPTKVYDWSTINKLDTTCFGFAGNGSTEGGKRQRRTRQARRRKNRRTRSRK